jgi:hypothetical protein
MGMKAAAARVCVAPMSPEGAMRMLFNGVCLYFFQSTRGLQQGGPFQRICFLFVADALCAVLKKEVYRLRTGEIRKK